MLMRMLAAACVCLVVGLGCKREAPQTPVDAVEAKEVAQQVTEGTGSPIEDYRRARYNKAIRGLTYDSGRVEFAPDWLDILNEEPDNMDAAVSLAAGADFLNQSMFTEALQAYTRAVLLDRSSIAAYEGLAAGFLGKGKVDKAMAALNTALSLDPSLLSARIELAECHGRLADVEGAIAGWNDVLELDPNNTHAHERLAITFYFAQRFAESWEHVHAAERLGHAMPPQFRPLLARYMAEPQS